MKELSNGDDEMRCCDENGNILSDSPVIIAKPSDELTDPFFYAQKNANLFPDNSDDSDDSDIRALHTMT